MSRIGKKPVQIPSGVTVTLNGSTLVVKGPKGELTHEIHPNVVVKIDNDIVTFEIKEETKENKALWGLTRALTANMVQGVTEGFEKKLELVGVGYRVKTVGKNLELTVGFSHPVSVEAPAGITFEVADNKNISIQGIDKHMVGQVAANIRKIRKPEPYKGKGIKYIDEVVRRKPGKAGKV